MRFISILDETALRSHFILEGDVSEIQLRKISGIPQSVLSRASEMFKFTLQEYFSEYSSHIRAKPQSDLPLDSSLFL